MKIKIENFIVLLTWSALIIVGFLTSCSADEEQRVVNCGTITVVHKNQSKPGYTIMVKNNEGYTLTYDDISNAPQVGNRYCR